MDQSPSGMDPGLRGFLILLINASMFVMSNAQQKFFYDDDEQSDYIREASS